MALNSYSGRSSDTGTFTFTGGPQVYKVPAGVNAVVAELVGGRGRLFCRRFTKGC
jgi:hypothetical protein